MSRILIADDHPIVCMAVRLLLEREGYEVVGEVDNGADALSSARELEPDLLLLDIGIPKLDGLEVTTRCRALEKPPKVLVLTAQDPVHFAVRCMRAGADGFVCKQEDYSELLAAVKAVLAGYSFFPSEALRGTLNGDAQAGSAAQLMASLTRRELAILIQLASGYSNKQIGEMLLISNKTVSSYKTRLMEKLNAQSLVELIEFAKSNALV